MGQIVLDRNSVQVPLLFAALAAGSLWARSSWAPAEPDLRNDGLAAGKFLIAPREPLDPHFATTVVLLISYDESGAVGLVINRPTEIPIARALEGLKPAKKAPGNVYAGGPVQPDSVFALYRAERKPGKGMRLFGDVYLASARPALESALASKRTGEALRVYLGYTGWAPGQLEHEMDLEVWRILPADAQSVFSPDASAVWPRLIEKTEMRLADLPAFSLAGVRMIRWR